MFKTFIYEMKGEVNNVKKGETIYKRNDKRWEARYVKEKNTYVRIIKYVYVYAKSYIEVKRKREKIIEDINNIKKTNTELFDIYIINWLNEKTLIKDSTYYNYHSILNVKLIPFFKKTRLDFIDDSSIIKITNSNDNKEHSCKIIINLKIIG